MAAAAGVSLLREFAAGLFGVPEVAECLVIVSTPAGDTLATSTVADRAEIRGMAYRAMASLPETGTMHKRQEG